MSNRFGRNQRRKMRDQVLHAQEAALHAQKLAFEAHQKLAMGLLISIDRYGVGAVRDLGGE